MIWWFVGFLLIIIGAATLVLRQSFYGSRPPGRVIVAGPGVPAWQASFDDNTDPIGGDSSSVWDEIQRLDKIVVDATDELTSAWNDVVNVLGPPPRRERIHLTDEEVNARFAVFERDAAKEIQRRQREGL